jgi:hypothetical protein
MYLGVRAERADGGEEVRFRPGSHWCARCAPLSIFGCQLFALASITQWRSINAQTALDVLGLWWVGALLAGIRRIDS